GTVCGHLVLYKAIPVRQYPCRACGAFDSRGRGCGRFGSRRLRSEFLIPREQHRHSVRMRCERRAGKGDPRPGRLCGGRPPKPLASPEVIRCLTGGFGEVASGRFLLGEELAGQEEVDEALCATGLLDRVFEKGAVAAAVDTE